MEGVTFRRVRRLEIHCKVRPDENIMLMPVFTFSVAYQFRLIFKFIARILLLILQVFCQVLKT